MQRRTHGASMRHRRYRRAHGGAQDGFPIPWSAMIALTSFIVIGVALWNI